MTIASVGSNAEAQDRAIAALTLAFIRDPMMRYLFPEARAYLAHFPAFARVFGGGAFAAGTAWISEDQGGAALWLPSGVHADGETLAAAPELLHALIDEIVAVARAEGVALDLEETRATALAVYADTEGHRASLAVDLAEGRRTEIDAMCLEVARRGAAHGVPTPVNEVVGRLVSAREPR